MQGAGEWAHEFAHEAANANGDWADEFAKGVAAPLVDDGTDIDRWADEFDQHAAMYTQAAASTSAGTGEYIFSPNNPFLQACHAILLITHWTNVMLFCSPVHILSLVNASSSPAHAPHTHGRMTGQLIN